MPFSTTAKNAMLDSLTVDRVRLHSGDLAANAAGAYTLVATTTKLRITDS
jgi:hypothetical protein